MRLLDAAVLAKALMYQHGLCDVVRWPRVGWHFQFDRSKRRFGCCKYSKRTITLSGPIVALNPEPEVRDCILHEIAHAMCMGRDKGHGHVWKMVAATIGARPERCYDSAKVHEPAAAYAGNVPDELPRVQAAQAADWGTASARSAGAPSPGD